MVFAPGDTVLNVIDAAPGDTVLICVMLLPVENVLIRLSQRYQKTKLEKVSLFLDYCTLCLKVL